MTPELELLEVSAGYDGHLVLDGMSFEIQPGEIVALIGRNGCGKTTALRVIIGTVRADKGAIRFGGQEITSLATSARVALGLTIVPQKSNVFNELTVRENLLLGSHRLGKAERSRSVEQVLAEYPFLRERIRDCAGKMSGGEKQILALAMAFVRHPRMILLDELSHSLDQAHLAYCRSYLKRLVNESKVTLLLAEQNIKFVKDICSRILVMSERRIASSLSPVDPNLDEAIRATLASGSEQVLPSA